MTDSIDALSRTVYTVSRLNRETRFLLNECFGSLWIEGEISNLSAPASGHLYFTLKDAGAQVRCAMFRPQNRLLDFKPANGDHVLASAQVSLYEPRGDFQLVVETLEAAGDGALLRAFEALKQRLAAEGLFDQALKKPLPALPACIGVITSPTGAAVRDILSVLGRRFPAIPVVIFPVKVQGQDAAPEIVRALARAERFGECDVLVLARGGGSLEDLWAFNAESVARAIAACGIPVVTGIGHETDFTIADFVADYRAPTPSAAAEAVSPDAAEWRLRFQRLEAQLQQRVRALLDRHDRTLAFLDRRLNQVHPGPGLRTQSQRLDELELRLRRAVRRILENRSQRAAHLGHRLQAVSPLATLARGYSITRRLDDGRIVRSCRDVEPGDRLETRVSAGVLISRVEAVRESPDR
jgi:exodeoxyribonuclease VII large subunit